MKKALYILFSFLYISSSSAQDWQAFTDSIPTLSSPRSSDLNGDGVMDIVIGGGTDGVFSNNGIMAYNGVDGSLLWKRSSRDEVFGSAIFQDITADGIKDVIIVGRSAQLLAIDGTNGVLLWDYLYINPTDSGLFNFYNPQFIDDVDGDTYPDILVANGGDHSAPSWQTNRPPGHLMVVSALTGNLIVKAVVPDSAETYCSAIVADIHNTGHKWILYGTGGENFGGHFYADLLDHLLLGDLTQSIVLASDSNKGFIAPAAIHKNNSSGYDIIIQSFDGLVTKIAGQGFSPIWTYQKPGTESSAQPVIGNFTGDLIPDILLVLFKGVAPGYTDFYQVMLDGDSGAVHFLDSLGAHHYASGNAVDLNNDGRDEGLYSIAYQDSIGTYYTRVVSIDFTTNDTITIDTLDQTRTGINTASTPLIADLDNNGILDLVYSVKKDSIDAMWGEGLYIYRHELNSIIPNSGIAWGSYLGTNMDGIYNSELTDCGNGAVISSVNATLPSCNGYLDGGINLGVTGNSTPYTYLWSNQSTSSSIQNLGAGSYWVQVTDSTGCYELRTVNLNDPFAISYSIPVSPICPGDSNGVAEVSSTGCPCMFSGCTFLWSNGGTTQRDSSLPAGWNSVMITHLNGCIVEDSVLIPASVNTIGCTDPTACNYDSTAVCDDGSCWIIYGCIDPAACNYDANAQCDDGSCEFISCYGCTDPTACNYDSTAIFDDGSCHFLIGCTDTIACNYDSTAVCDDGSCYTINVVVSQTGVDIIAIITGGIPNYTYQWNTGETTGQITPTINGVYWVIVTDLDGCFSDTSNFTVNWIPTSIEDLSIYKFSVYPNPSEDIFNIEFASKQAQNIELKVINIVGEMIYTEELKEFFGDYSKKISLERNSRGIYFLEIKTNKRFFNTKLILY